MAHIILITNTHSITLLAVADSNYEWLYADIRANCRCHDRGIWRQSRLSIKLQEKGNLPSIPKSSPSSPLYIFRTRKIPYVFVRDDKFALSKHMIQHFPQRCLNCEKRMYKYHHSRANRLSENLFGIVANR